MLFCDESVTLSMSAASLRLWAMSSDSVSRSLSSVVLYNWPTSSLCRQSFTWFTRKCITAFGTLRPNTVKRIVRINDVNIYSIADEKPRILTYLSWMFFRTIRKYDLMSLSMTSQSLCSRADNFLDTGTGWQWNKRNSNSYNIRQISALTIHLQNIWPIRDIAIEQKQFLNLLIQMQSSHHI